MQIVLECHETSWIAHYRNRSAQSRSSSISHRHQCDGTSSLEQSFRSGGFRWSVPVIPACLASPLLRLCSFPRRSAADRRSSDVAMGETRTPDARRASGPLLFSRGRPCSTAIGLVRALTARLCDGRATEHFVAQSMAPRPHVVVGDLRARGGLLAPRPPVPVHLQLVQAGERGYVEASMGRFLDALDEAESALEWA
jgi:hypothetical protein